MAVEMPERTAWNEAGRLVSGKPREPKVASGLLTSLLFSVDERSTVSIRSTFSHVFIHSIDVS